MQHRITWSNNVLEFPEDLNLAIENNIIKNEISKLVEIYTRFYDLGWIDEYGDKCILMSTLLKRILRYHGIYSNTKQVILYYENSLKNKNLILGSPNLTQENANNIIDTHLVTLVENKYILDFSAAPIFRSFGNLYPKAFIATSNLMNDDWQQFGGLFGKATWVRSYPEHPIIKHWRLEQKVMIIKLVREYFKIFTF